MMKLIASGRIVSSTKDTVTIDKEVNLTQWNQYDLLVKCPNDEIISLKITVAGSPEASASLRFDSESLKSPLPFFSPYILRSGESGGDND